MSLAAQFLTLLVSLLLFAGYSFWLFRVGYHAGFQEARRYANGQSSRRPHERL
jgi:hypothetical protein